MPLSWPGAVRRLYRRCAAAPIPDLVVGGLALAVAAGAVVSAILASSLSRWVVMLLQGVAPLTALSLNLAGVILCDRARSEFSKDEPLYRIWSLALWAAACLVTSGVALLLASTSWFAAAGQGWVWLQQAWMQIATLLAGPAHAGFLLAAFWIALGVYRRAGLLARPRFSDWLLIALGVVFGAGNAGGWLWSAPERPVGLLTAAGLVRAPLLGALLIEAVLIRRSAAQMGRGLIARCWDCFALGILVVFAMEVMGWTSLRGPLPMAIGATQWYLYLASGVAFALAPAYQIEACRSAAFPARTEPAPALSGVVRDGPAGAGH